MIQRRNLLAGLATTLTLAACGRGGGSPANTLRVGSQKGGTKALMLSSGALDGAPYAVEWSEFPAAQNLLEALGSDAVDLGLVGDAPFQFAYQAGSPIKVVGAQATQQVQPGAIALIVPGASPIHDAASLKGRRIATTRGSVGHYLLLRAIQGANLSSDSVRTVFLSPSDARAALQSGSVDGWSTWQPYVASALAEGDRIAIDGRSLTRGYGFDVAPEKALRDKQALIADFLDREAKALSWADSHADAFAKVLAHETGLPQDIALQFVVTNGRRRVPIDEALIARQQEVAETFVRAGEFTLSRPIKEAFVARI